jgi:glycosyltransferase involved in cell wall biosynthesis
VTEKILIENRPLRVLWASDSPIATSGYANQTRLAAPRLAAHCDLALLATYGLQGGAIDWNGITLYPGWADPFGNDVIHRSARDWRADVVITLKDSVVFRPEAFQGLRWAPLVPIDHEPAPPAVIRIARAAWQPIAYAPNGVRALEDAGLAPCYAPHAFDPSITRPGDRAAARAAVGIRDDAFVVGTIAVNRGGVPSRKAWPQLIAGVAQAARVIPNLVYLAHTYHGEDGFEGAYNLRHLAAQHGIADHILLPDGEQYQAGFPDAAVTRLYQAMDVLLAVSAGEGFGIPTLEAQACGVPVIAGAWAAQEDLIFGGWALRRDADALRFTDQQGADIYIPFPESVAEAVIDAHAAVRDSAERAERQAAAIAGAAPFAIDRVVAEHWRPLLAYLVRRIVAERVPHGVVRVVRPEEVLHV